MHRISKLYIGQFQVWITLLLSMPITGVVIYLSIRPTTHRRSISDGMRRNILTLPRAIFEMLQVLLNQGYIRKVDVDYYNINFLIYKDSFQHLLLL